MARRIIDEMKDTDHPRVYRLARRHFICDQEGRCSYCPWHAGENNRSYRRHVSWKRRRKVRRQWMKD